jgi:hypothetical protein
MTPAQMVELRWEMTRALDPEDEVLVISLCARCVAGMRKTFSAGCDPDWPGQPGPYGVV